MTKLNIMCAGSIGGLCYSILVFPMELFRIKMQIQNEHSTVNTNHQLMLEFKSLKIMAFKVFLKGI